MTHARAARAGLWAFTALGAYAVNVAWELAQQPLYEGGYNVMRCIVAAGWDVVYILGAMVLARAAGRRWSRTAYWATLTIALLMLAIGIESWALMTDRWSYASAMPTVFGLGLSPLVQLPLLGSAVAAVHISAARRSARLSDLR